MDIGLFYRIGLLALWLVEEELKLYIDSVCLLRMEENHVQDLLLSQRNVIPIHVHKIQMNYSLQVYNKDLQIVKLL
jgi:hypothetical protein